MASDIQPRTANLLACKQWWKVCFLYGDQEKYYRQVYGRAASQRLALSTTSSTGGINEACNSHNDNISNSGELKRNANPNKEILLFPHKNHKGILIKNPHLRKRLSSPSFGEERSLNREQRERSSDRVIDRTEPNSRVTVLDDPFLLGRTPNLSKDSGINNIDDGLPPPLPLKATKPRPASYNNNRREFRDLLFSSDELKNDLQLNDTELMTFQLNCRSGYCPNPAIQQLMTSSCPTSQQNPPFRNSADHSNCAINSNGQNHPQPPPLPPLLWSSATGDNCSKVQQMQTTATNNNNGLCSQIDKILDNNNLRNET